VSRTLFTIVNPAAGGGKCGERCGSALARLRDAGLTLEVRRSDGPGHATELAREAYAQGHRRFLAVGGDGTSFEIVNGLFPRPDGDDDPIVLGMLPLGTGNSFLRDFGITGARRALDALVRGDERPCDVVRATHDHGEIFFVNLLSVGFSARAGELTNQRFKRLGAAGYVAAVLLCVASLDYPVIPLSLDGGEIDARPAALISFSNSKFTGGTMMMAPHADVADGAVDVIRVGALPRGRFVATFPHIFRGTHVSRPGIEETRAKRVDLLDDGERPVMVDGEIFNLSVRALEVMPRALTVIA
jgi:YegS/Rv2252/BmrU family lipid kinase